MPVATRPHALLLTAFSALDRAGVRWALLRGASELADPEGDVDLLVAPADWPAARAALAAQGFLQLPAPGHGPHRFCFAYDERHDRWLKLDVVIGVAFGHRQELRTDWHASVLSRRTRAGGLWRLAPRDEDELHLLHDLLDKAAARPDPALLSRLSRDDSRPGGGLLGALPDVVARLRLGEDPASCAAHLRGQWRRGTPAVVGVANRMRRRVHGGRRWRWGAGTAVALLGPDGAGKSTLASGLVECLPVHAVAIHLGLWSTTSRTRVAARVPLARTAVGLARAARVSTAARYHAARGRLAILDRSALDVKLQDADRSAGGRVVAGAFTVLAPTPSLVLVLDAPGEVMHARKGEHSPSVLERRRQDYLRLADGLPHAVVLDATRSADEVRRAALAAVWTHLSRQQGR